MRSTLRYSIFSFSIFLFGLTCQVSKGEAVHGQKEPPPKDHKNQYNLFMPTPKEHMREMSTDRPDKTESAYTVDAGHFQMEMDILSYSIDLNNTEKTNTRVTSWNVTAMNLKAGLLNNVDIQFMIPPYNWERTKARTDEDGDGAEEIAVEEKDGFGDFVTRVKVNLWGNDGGETAFAAMPYIKFPTNESQLGNDSVEGGLIFPLAVDLPCEWGMGVMTQFDFNQNSLYDGYHIEFVNSITFGHKIIGDLSGYVEFFSMVSSEPGSSWVGTIDTGLTYALTDNIQLDAGINTGVTRAADDFNPFIGLSMRF